MVVVVGRLRRVCLRPCLVFCALAACCLVLTVVSRLSGYRRWVSDNSALPATEHSTVVATQTVVPPDAVVAWSWNHSAATVTRLDDIFISVKTTGKYHSTRIGLLLRTWLRLAQKQVRLV